MLDDELLAPDFDPTTLTIPQLKAALTAVGVTLPLRQERKTVYVELFQRHISAKAERLRREKRAVRPSAEGIMAVSGSGSPRYEETEALRGMYRDGQSSVSATAPGLKLRKSASGHLSMDNPYQSATKSPLASSITDEKSSTRKTSQKAARRRSSSNVRKSRRDSGTRFWEGQDDEEEEQDADQRAPAEASTSDSENTASRPSSRARRSSKSSTPSPKSFRKSPVSPDKFLASTPPIPIAGYVDVQHVLAENRRRMQASRTVKRTLRKVAFGVVLALLALCAIHLQRWRTQPYCGTGEEPWPSTMDTSANEWFGVPLRLPQCRSCPTHGVCIGNELERCTNGYILRRPMFPWHATCAPDLVKYANVEKLRADMSSILSEHAGNVECGTTVGDTFIVEDKIQGRLRKMHSSWEPSRFDDYWEILMTDLHREPSPEIKFNLRGSGTRLFYSTKPTYSMSCRIAKYILNFLAANKLYFGGALASVLAILALYMRVSTTRERKQRTQELVDGVISVLIEQEELFRSGREEMAAVSVTHLRDFFLADVRSLRKRAEIWMDVRRELLHHSSIRETCVLIEGEQNDAWQWVGSSSLLSPARRRARSVSVAAAAPGGSYVSDVDDTPMQQTMRMNKGGSLAYPSL